MSFNSILVAFFLFITQQINSQVTLSICQTGIKGDTLPEVGIADYQDQQPKRLNDSTIEFTFHPSEPECLFIFIEAKTRWFTRVWIDPKIAHKELIIDYSKRTSVVKGGNEWDEVLGKVILLDQQGKSNESDSVSMAFLDKNPGSYFSLWLLSHGLFREKPSEKLTALKKLDPSLKDYPEYKQTMADLLDRKYPKTGDLFKEFALQDKNEKVFKSNTIHNKWILLHFWSNGCGPCLKEMDALVQLYKSIDTTKIEFISVALDEKKDTWKNSMHTAKIIWPSVWQPDNFYGELCLNYNVYAMPFFILFDPNKKIVFIKDGANELESIQNFLLSIK